MCRKCKSCAFFVFKPDSYDIRCELYKANKPEISGEFLENGNTDYHLGPKVCGKVYSLNTYFHCTLKF